MGDARFLPGLVLVALAAGVVLVGLLASGLSRPGRRRAGLVAGGLPLSLLPPVVATAYASWKVVGLFEGLGQAQTGAARNALEAFASLWMLQRVAWGAFVASCVVGLLLGLWRSGRSTDELACTVRRGLVLLLLPALGLVVAALATRPLVSALRVSAAVISSDEKDPASRQRSDAVLEAEGLPTRGSASAASTSRFLSRALMTGLFGGAIAAVVLLGLALPGFILAWRVGFGAAFSAAAAIVWLLAAVGAGLVAFGALDPLRLA
jgi:hypothetical protein